MWEIIDDNGTIHTGDEIEMTTAFDVMTNPLNHTKEDIITYNTDWNGDLKLVEVHKVSR